MQTTKFTFAKLKKKLRPGYIFKRTSGQSVKISEIAYYEPPYLYQFCLQIQLFQFWRLKL